MGPWSKASVMAPRLSMTGFTSVNETRVSRKPGHFWASLQCKPSLSSAPVEKDKKRERTALSSAASCRGHRSRGAERVRDPGQVGAPRGSSALLPAQEGQAPSSPLTDPRILALDLEQPSGHVLGFRQHAGSSSAGGPRWPLGGRRDPGRTAPADEILTVWGPGEL